MSNFFSTPTGRRVLLYGLGVLVLAVGTVGVLLLFENISERKFEGRQVYFAVVNLDENTVDPAVWGKNFPNQYDGYLRTVDTLRTKYGGSEAFQKLDAFPIWRELFRGYAFGIDYREERGHAYMLSDQRHTERVTKKKQPGACLQCHASVIPAYRKVGVTTGHVPDDVAHRDAAIMRGFELVNAMPYSEATQLVQHPIACLDCHNPATMQLRVTRPGFLVGIQRLAESNDAVPHLPSIERWRRGNRAVPYDVNTLASHQEMRAFVCGQCHVEYYFKGKNTQLTYPWHNGLKVEQIEAYYDTVGWKDWTHATSGALVVKAQHPEFEIWSQGIHARSGVTCADCHMPYMRVGAVKISDHQVRSPLLNINRACQGCHRVSENELMARAMTIQGRTYALSTRAENATYELVMAIKAAKDAGMTDTQLSKPRDMHRKAQWRLDFVAAENSMGFHASQETARILAEAIDYARQGGTEVARLLGSQVVGR
jgi:nitrite reductase (cytochrome c-552)